MRANDADPQGFLKIQNFLTQWREKSEKREFFQTFAKFAPFAYFAFKLRRNRRIRQATLRDTVGKPGRCKI